MLYGKMSVLQILKKCIKIHLVSAIKMWGICSLIQLFLYLKRKNNQSYQKIQTSFILYCDHQLGFLKVYRIIIWKNIFFNEMAIMKLFTAMNILMEQKCSVTYINTNRNTQIKPLFLWLFLKNCLSRDKEGCSKILRKMTKMVLIFVLLNHLLLANSIPQPFTVTFRDQQAGMKLN